MLAYLVDVALLFVVLAPLGFLVQRLLGMEPASTPRGIYLTLLLNFSLPVFVYFTASDASAAGSTLGKRILGLRVEDGRGSRLTVGRAALRTAIKVLPWETTHASAFLVVPALGHFGTTSWGGLAVAYAASLVYLVVAWRSGGRRSVHDLAAGSRVMRRAA